MGDITSTQEELTACSATAMDKAAALNAALGMDDLNLFLETLGPMARAHRMVRVAHETGLGRESLYKSLRPGASPEFATVFKVLHSLGFQFRVCPTVGPDKYSPEGTRETLNQFHDEGEWKLVDDARVNRDLSIIGKQTFVTYFEVLVDFSIPDNEVADFIASELGCTPENAVSWRVKPARNLIRAGQAKTGLQIISQSNRLPSHITKRASELAETISETTKANHKNVIPN